MSATKVPTFRAWSAQYEKIAQLQLSRDSLTKRRSILRALVAGFGDTPIDAIGPEEVDAYARARLAGGLKRVSVNNEVRVLRTVLVMAVEREQLARAPRFRLLPDRESAAKRVKVWTRDEVRALLEACGRVSPELAPLLTFLALSGCRRGEGLALTWEQVDFGRRTISVRAVDNEHDEGPGGAAWVPKWGKAREVPIGDELLELLEARPRTSRWVFPCKSGRRWVVWPQGAYERAQRAAGLAGGPHTLRHTYASHFLAATGDLALLSQILGHSDARTTRLYAHLLPDHLASARDVVRLVPALPKLSPPRLPPDPHAPTPGFVAKLVGLIRKVKRALDEPKATGRKARKSG